MRAIISTLAELAGLALVAVGLGLAWLPAGIIAAGVAVLVVGYALGAAGVEADS